MNKTLLIPLLLLSTFLYAQNGEFYIGGEAVKEISLSVGVSSIDFGDVYRDSEVNSVPVDFYVNAEDGYDYTVDISNDDSSGVVQLSRTANGGYTVDSINYIDTATGGEQRHEFYVDLDTGNISGDLSATITVMVAYNDIAE